MILEDVTESRMLNENDGVQAYERKIEKGYTRNFMLKYCVCSLPGGQESKSKIKM
jgi:hypothetical protein